MNDAEKTEVKRIVKSRSSKLIDLFNLFFKEINRETEESVPPSPES